MLTPSSTPSPAVSCDHEVIQDGDVVLVLNNPNAPFAVWDSSDAPSPSPATGSVTFLVSSHHLKSASPVFSAALTGPWDESVPAADGRRRIAAEHWDPEALLILLNLIHGRNNRVPRTLTLEMLCKVSVLVDYYSAHEAARFPGLLWIDSLRPSMPQEYGRDLILWLCISWVFQDEDVFKVATATAVRGSIKPVSALSLPIPEAVIGRFSGGHPGLDPHRVNVVY
ncbi:hypothetical protein VTH06DRAFT_2688 [Thermothelomyces fergusii]